MLHPLLARPRRAVRAQFHNPSGFRCASLFPGLLGLGLCLVGPRLAGQIAIPAFHTPVTENFNSLGTAATANLPANWRLSAAGDTSVAWGDATHLTATSAQASSGTPTIGGRYNWGQSVADRALGFMSSSGYASPNHLLAHFSNGTGRTITDLSIAFDYERYRLNTAPASITFFHSTDGSTWSAAAAGDSGAFTTGASSYGFATPISSSSHLVTLASLNLAPGADFYLRWQFNTGGANSQGLGVDNFSLTAIPEPSTYAALGGAAAFAGAWWHRRRRPAAPAAPQRNHSSPTPAA